MGQRRIKRRSVKINAEMKAGFLRQLEAFRLKFGREPGPDDPIFFDPDSDTPQPIPEGVIEAATIAAMVRAGLPGEFVYAYKKTGLIVTQTNMHDMPPDDLAAWEQAIDEYFAQTKPQ